MKSYQSIFFEEQDKIGTLWLNRPQIRNAFNEGMIAELLDFFQEMNKREDLLALVIRGKGTSFCAGADLNWMRDVSHYTLEQNLAESRRLSACFQSIYSCSIPTIALVHGAAIGGANGLIAACDVALAEENTVFSLSEVKIGIIPACIAPFIMKRIGEFNARFLMLSGKRIYGKEAAHYGLINSYGPLEAMEEELSHYLDMIKTSAPQAVRSCKKLINHIANDWVHMEALEETAQMIARIRLSEEGQEGMSAFLEKRKPNWVD